MGIGEYIMAEMQKKEITKQFISSQLGISRQGLDLKLKNNKIDVNDYLRLSSIIGFKPESYFNLFTPENQQIDINQVNEPQSQYRNIKNYGNDKLRTSTNLDSLIEQNMKLIEIIDRLTKEQTDRPKAYK